MKRLIALFVLGSTAATAQVSGPLVSGPAEMAVSDSLAVIASMGQANAFAVREIRVNRDHKMRKNVDQTLQLARADTMVTNVSVPTGAAYAQTATYQPLGAPIGVNFEALGVGTPGYGISGAPPDTTLGVSPTQIVQWVNTQIGIYDKAGNSLLPLPGFLNGNQIWAGLPAGSLCRQVNRGDPLVQYDRLAQRWILSQFAFNDTQTQNAQCIAVSTTSNALGSYVLYQYNFGALLPDYGKLGIWPNAYFLTYNMFNVNANTFNGGQACAYDRAAMIAGLAAQQICFNSLARFSFLPADLDGTNLPPAGAPNYLISWNWVFTLPPYTLQLTKFALERRFYLDVGRYTITFGSRIGGRTRAQHLVVPRAIAIHGHAFALRVVRHLVNRAHVVDGGRVSEIGGLGDGRIAMLLKRRLHAYVIFRRDVVGRVKHRLPLGRHFGMLHGTRRCNALHQLRAVPTFTLGNRDEIVVHIRHAYTSLIAHKRHGKQRLQSAGATSDDRDGACWRDGGHVAVTQQLHGTHASSIFIARARCIRPKN